MYNILIFVKFFYYIDYIEINFLNTISSPNFNPKDRSSSTNDTYNSRDDNYNCQIRGLSKQEKRSTSWCKSNMEGARISTSLYGCLGTFAVYTTRRNRIFCQKKLWVKVWTRGPKVAKKIENFKTMVFQPPVRSAHQRSQRTQRKNRKVLIFFLSVISSERSERVVDNILQLWIFPIRH